MKLALKLETCLETCVPGETRTGRSSVGGRESEVLRRQPGWIQFTRIVTFPVEILENETTRRSKFANVAKKAMFINFFRNVGSGGRTGLFRPGVSGCR